MHYVEYRWLFDAMEESVKYLGYIGSKINKMSYYKLQKSFSSQRCPIDNRKLCSL